MSNMLEKIKGKRKDILTGEIGALLHDIGKSHPYFIHKNSIEEKHSNFEHDNIESFSKELSDLFKNKIFEFQFDKEKSNIYELIKKHHENGNKLIKYLRVCDRKDSADDKGIVRRKQSIKNVTINSPFGYNKEIIEPKHMLKQFDDLKNEIILALYVYTSNKIDIYCFRDIVFTLLKTYFSHVLAETRIPSNDVTLWDHSYSVASLFKSILAGLAHGEVYETNDLKWRIFGICWNGTRFINNGRKIAEIQAINAIIGELKKKLKLKFEVEIPIGNAIYEDENGIYFTFPELGSDLEEIAKECSEIALKIICEESDHELWPFFTLSQASKTLTITANEINFACKKRRIPKRSPVLFIENEVKANFDNFLNNVSVEGQDICPICKIRSKKEESARCKVCEDRKKGRLSSWLRQRRRGIIWIDEIADKNNRISLISLDFKLDNWLNGKMVRTIYSQSLDLWYEDEIKKIHEILDKTKQSINEEISKIENVLENMTFATDRSDVAGKIEKKNKEKNELERALKQFRFKLNSDKKTAFNLLDLFICTINQIKGQNINNREKKKYKQIATDILKTFFAEKKIVKANVLDKHIENIKEKIQPISLTKKTLATFLLTQNPSPARLNRIWKEIEEFFTSLTREIEDNVFKNKYKRIMFRADKSRLSTELTKFFKENTQSSCILRIDGMVPKNLLVLHIKNGEFCTIESLGKFEFDKMKCEMAIENALKQGFTHLALEDDPKRNLLNMPTNNQGTNQLIVDPASIKIEQYLPIIEINKTPFIFRLIVPTSDSMKIMELILRLYEDRFKKVIGKLPLNAKLLVTNKKFPLYVLLDAERRMLGNEKFKMPQEMEIWWDITGIRNDPYYGFYPIRFISENERYTLDDLSKIKKGKNFILYPGHFDFDLLLGTTDRYHIFYKERRRGDPKYALYSKRPLYFYELRHILDLWDVLSNLSSSKRNFIEKMLVSKLREWRNVKDKGKVLMQFMKTTIIDAFGDIWKGLKDETRFLILNSALNGILLDVLLLFQNVIKKEVIYE